MRLDRDSREYVRWPVTGAPTGAVFEMQFTSPAGVESAWVPAETVSATEIRKLLAGPDADPGTAYVLAAGRTHVKFRLTDTPEIVPRSGSVIDVE